MIFGFCILALVGTVIVILALGKVQKETSYGLDIILVMLAPLVNKWSDWAFGKKSD